MFFNKLINLRLMNKLTIGIKRIDRTFQFEANIVLGFRIDKKLKPFVYIFNVIGTMTNIIL